MITFEVYICLYKYNVYKNNNNQLSEIINDNETVSKSFLQISLEKPIHVQCYYHFLLFLLKFFALFFFAVRFLVRLNYSTLVIAYRRMVVLTLTCQWSLCMYYLENHAYKLQAIMKSVLKPINLNLHPLVNPFVLKNGYTCLLYTSRCV